MGSTAAQLYGVYEISKLLTAPSRLEVTLAKVVQVLTSFLDMRLGLIAVLDDQGDPEIVVGSEWSEGNARRYFEDLPERAVGHIVATATPLVIRNIRDDPRWEGRAFSGVDLSFIGVPIRGEGKVIGTLSIDRVARPEGDVTLDGDIRFLAMVSNLVGQTIRLQRLVTLERERLMEDRRRLERELDQTTAGQRRDNGLAGIVGESDTLLAVIEKIRMVARSNTTVLLRGESGTGKELFARAIHDLSPRKDRAYVKVNCAALPESVLESELFGHERGAFTGASSLRKGRFELAQNGTLFLDEIGEISPAFQAKLLRVLQEGEFERVGGSTTLKVDVRIVVATNRNLEEAVANGEFRADLYYRIGVIPIALPSLRERKGDIPLLAGEFLGRFDREHGATHALSDDAVALLSKCPFPGNVRELENCVRRTATMCTDQLIRASSFACSKGECLSAALWQYTPRSPAPRGDPGSHGVSFPTRGAIAAAANVIPAPLPGPAPSAVEGETGDERHRLTQAMESVGWVQAKAARLLRLTPRQIGYALRKYDIPIRKF